MRNSSFIDYEWQRTKCEKVIFLHAIKILFLFNLKYSNRNGFIGMICLAKILPQNCMDLVKPDPGLIQSKPEPSVYRCRKCRRIVAAKSNLITHAPATGAATDAVAESSALADSKHVTFKAEIHVQNESSSDESKIAAPPPPPPTTTITTSPKRLLERVNTLCISSTSEKSSADDTPPRCQEILFIEPLAWMLDISKQTQGKLNCPKCHSKLGSFTWINSCNCPCGKNISPAFYLVPSKVELTHSVQNVEMTV